MSRDRRRERRTAVERDRERAVLLLVRVLRVVGWYGNGGCAWSQMMTAHPPFAQESKGTLSEMSDGQAAAPSSVAVPPRSPPGAMEATFAVAFLPKSLGSESRKTFFHAEPTCLGSEPVV